MQHEWLADVIHPQSFLQLEVGNLLLNIMDQDARWRQAGWAPPIS